MVNLTRKCYLAWKETRAGKEKEEQEDEKHQLVTLFLFYILCSLNLFAKYSTAIILKTSMVSFSSSVPEDNGVKALSSGQ
eukprot:scaffold8334_cov164-Ochromonas_danica.AAC.1